MADLIERYKITANLPSVMMNYCNRFNSKQIELITEMIYELENSIESADVQPVRRGKWICTNNYEILAYGTLHYSRCSVCGEESLEEGSFCPNCGAEMRGEDDA